MQLQKPRRTSAAGAETSSNKISIVSEDDLAHRSASVKFTRPIVVVEAVTKNKQTPQAHFFLQM